jgi:feruloyl-CoA synthase
MTTNTRIRSVRLGTTDATAERRADGSVLLKLNEPLLPYPVKLTECLVRWAREAPDRTFLAQRGLDGEWDRLSFAETLRKVRALGQALLARDLNESRPVMILSENSVENALLALAAMYVGVPYAPVSPSYSLLSTDFAKLRRIVDTIQPGLVFAASAHRYARAVTAVFPTSTEIVIVGAPESLPSASTFGQLLASDPSQAVDAAFDAVDADTIAKVLFTSGSTGFPKGVMFSQRMLCSNRQQLVQALPFLQDQPPTLVDWLPWHHTFGGTQNIGIALYSGGSFYIDEGRPFPDGVMPTVRNLGDIAPTIYFNTPKGFDALIPHFRRDKALRERFFSRLQLIYYGGAKLPEPTWAAMDELAVQTIGARILIVSGIGCTEAGPTPTTTNWDPKRQALAGLPVPGVVAKLAPVGDKFELRLKGPCVMPGYWRDAQATKRAFDDEDFYCLGDAIKFLDSEHPEKGMRFDGRIAENFKLTSGTWVNVFEIREGVMSACAPYVRDVVIAGHDRDFIAALVFPDIDACRRLCPTLGDNTPVSELLETTAVRVQFQKLFSRLKSNSSGSSKRIERFVVEVEMATLDTGEMTDKTTVSQRAVLERRVQVVNSLFAESPNWPVVVV